MADSPALRQLRREYASRSLEEQSTDPNPIRQFRTWLDEALVVDLVDPTAMVLATVTPDGDPTSRVVLLKDLDEDGFVFFTHYTSPKGQHLATHPRAALLFYWSELERQVRVSGDVQRVDAVMSDDYFATRPRDSQIAAWAAPQSSELASREDLVRRYEAVSAKYEGRDVPRPPDWGGYRLRPARIEFWQGRPGRLHDRLQYTRQDDGRWIRVRLAP